MEACEYGTEVQDSVVMSTKMDRSICSWKVDVSDNVEHFCIQVEK